MADDDSRSDADLLAAYAGGNSGAATTLARRHAPRVLAVATRMLAERSEAEDITQDALMRLWRIAPDWDAGRAQVSTWLYRVAANLCIDRLRKRARIGALPDGMDPEDPTPPVLARIQDGQRQDALEQALQSLPERQRLAVILRHIEDLSNPEIAQAMDISVEAVESLTARGRAALTRALAPRREALGYE